MTELPISQSFARTDSGAANLHDAVIRVRAAATQREIPSEAFRHCNVLAEEARYAVLRSERQAEYTRQLNAETVGNKALEHFATFKANLDGALEVRHDEAQLAMLSSIQRGASKALSTFRDIVIDSGVDARLAGFDPNDHCARLLALRELGKYATSLGFSVELALMSSDRSNSATSGDLTTPDCFICEAKLRISRSE